MSSSNAAYFAVPRDQTDGDILHIGHQCDSQTCSLVDFLPLKCQHCSKSFCADHFKPADHNCTEYDVTKHDRIAPQCPLCNSPVAIPPGEDPNVRMERHINTECSVMTGRTKSSSTPTCGNARCHKKLFAPIECDNCHQKFCAEHRYPKAHACVSLDTTLNGRKEISNTKAAALATIQAMKSQASSAPARKPLLQRLKAQAAAASNPTSGNKAGTSSSASKSPFSSTNSSSLHVRDDSLPTNVLNPDPPAPTSTLPVTNGNRCAPTPINNILDPQSRAAEERRSQRQAMLARAQKGLLSAEEQARLEADLAEEEKDGKNCKIM